MDAIRRFGLEYCDLPTMLWNVGVMLRILILNIDSSYKKRPHILFYIFTFLCITCYFYVYLISTIYYVGWMYPKIQNTVSTLILLSLGMSSEIGTTKYIYMYFERKRLVEIIDDMRICDSTVPTNSRMEANIYKTLRNVKRRAIIFWLIIMLNGIVYIGMPLVLPGQHLIEDAQILLGLEPMFESPNYEIAYTMTSIAVVQVVFVPANVTALFIILIGYIEAQMSALTAEFENLYSDAEENRTLTNQNIDDYIKNRLQELILRHSTVITLLRRLENVYRVVIAVEFILLVIGVIFELLGGLENTYMEIPYAFMQVFMDCLTGQRLLEASLAFEKAIYFSKWEEFNCENRRTLVTILLCSQKSLTLSAGGVTVLAYTSFLSIVRSVYSAYATLSRVVHRV